MGPKDWAAQSFGAGRDEPDLDMLQDAVLAQGSFEEFREFIWCGYGEPTFRLDLIRQAASWLRSAGAKIRLNTNGHACLIHGRDVLAELAPAVDEVSVSLNAPNCRRYVELCRPDPNFSRPGERIASGACLGGNARLSVLALPLYFAKVQASVVGFAAHRAKRSNPAGCLPVHSE